MIRTFMDKHKLMVFTSKISSKENSKGYTSRRMTPAGWFKSKKEYCIKTANASLIILTY